MPDEATPTPSLEIQEPPKTLGGILKQLGPGLIIAGSIVGSGELIATTAVGAEAGFVLMWLIIIGCLIKVFVQIEFGKYAIVNGKTTLDGMNEVPGPRFLGSPKKRANWICWFWLVFIVVALVQIGGIIGGVGQALSIPLPLSEQGKTADEYYSHAIRADVLGGIIHRFEDDPDMSARVDELRIERAELLSRAGALEGSDIDPQRRELLIRYESLTRLIALLADHPSDDFAIEPLQQEQESVAGILAESYRSSPDLTEKQRRFIQSEAIGRVLVAAEKAGWDDSVVADDKQKLARLNAWKSSNDPVMWATLVTLVSIVILVVGRYKLIQNFSTALVASFTLVTIVNLVYLQLKPEWAVGWDEFVAGMTFRIPKGDGLATALAAFGIIGVGATELIQYPYWCIEKGYAKWTGPRDDSEAWAQRAHGWLRVLKWDAWCSMVVYTFATIAFYLLGAAILGRTGLNPSGDQMVRTLGEMYVPVFGDAAHYVFLFGAFAVLYSTFFVATASHARTLADALRVFGLSAGGEKAYVFWTRIFCVALPLWFLACYAYFKMPKQLVLVGGFMGALMLPLLGVTALYGRYRRSDDRLRPSPLWDVFLWLSVVGLFIAGGWAFFDKLIKPFI